MALAMLRMGWEGQWGLLDTQTFSSLALSLIIDGAWGGVAASNSLAHIVVPHPGTITPGKRRAELRSCNLNASNLWVCGPVQADHICRICPLASGEGLESLGPALPTDSPTLPPGGDYLGLRHGEQESKRVPFHRCTGGRRQEVGPSGDISGLVGSGEKRREACIRTSLPWSPWNSLLLVLGNKPFYWGGVSAAEEVRRRDAPSRSHQT